MPRPTILIDCDPGHDDAMAIVAAARHADLLGITTVHGNAPLARTTANALVMTQLLGIDTPVHSGADRPLTAPARHAPGVHGDSGLDGAALPPLARRAASTDAVRFIVDTVRAHQGIWLVAIGPLTNIALALRAAPALAGAVAGISLMGGSATFGNRTPVAEFNVWCDPEAADIVFGCGAPIIMSGLHLTHQAQATPARIAAIAAIGTEVSAIVADLLTFYSDRYRGTHRGLAGAPVHDVCAVLALTHPHLFARRAARVDVELTGTHTRGMTVVDQRPMRDLPASNVALLDTVDADGLFAALTEAVARSG